MIVLEVSVHTFRTKRPLPSSSDITASLPRPRRTLDPHTPIRTRRIRLVLPTKQKDPSRPSEYSPTSSSECLAALDSAGRYLTSSASRLPNPHYNCARLSCRTHIPLKPTQRIAAAYTGHDSALVYSDKSPHAA